MDAHYVRAHAAGVMITEVYNLKSIFFKLLFLSSTLVCVGCVNAQTTLEMNTSSSKNLKLIEKELQDVSDTYLEGFSEEQVSLFKTSSQEWLGYRKAHCDFRVSGVKGGSAYILVKNNCLISETKRRISEIEGLLNCQEGDLSCP